MEDDDSIIMPITEWPPPLKQNIETIKHDLKHQHEYETEKIHKKLKSDFCFTEYPQVDTTLAVWFRKNSSTLKQKYKMPKISNPKTILNIVAGFTEGKNFLQCKLDQLIDEKLAKNSASNPTLLYAIAAYQDKLGYIEEGLSNIKQCLQLLGIDRSFMELKSSLFLQESVYLSEFEKKTLWLFSKLSMESEMLKEAEKTNKSNKLTVTRIDANHMDLKTFKKDYCATKTPVVIINSKSPTLVPWTLEHIATVAGGCSVDIKTPVKGSCEWAGLEGDGRVNVCDFIQDKTPGHYLFDWSLPLYCPQLAEEFTIASCFSDDFLKRTSSCALYHSSWPSLFIAPAGTNSGLHIDAFGSHFWMYLVSGKKQWTFYPCDQAGLLGPKLIDSTDPVFSGDEGKSCSPYTVTLCPGEWLFVPAGSPHKVENLEESVAVSGNFVNDTNIEAVEKHLKINSLLDSRAFDLLKEFCDLNFVK